MTAYVFLGPTLPVADARRLLPDAVYLPPVIQGDVIRITLQRPSMIGIVDGTFERVPAVWHKEILWALDQGIPVLGASSMGALRAAELDAFGMEGIGWVYEAFRDDVLEDDDEVAVAHAAAEDGFRPLSDAMVNIRRTLAAARDAGVVGPHTHDLVIEAAKRRYYAERHHLTALQDAEVAGADASELTALRRFVATSAVDQKRADACALLSEMADRLARGATSVTTRFSFQYTDVWYLAQRSAGRVRIDAPTPESGDEAAGNGAGVVTTTDLLLDELRLDPDRYLRVWDGAYARLTALQTAQMEGFEVDEQRLEATSESFRRERTLEAPEDAVRWLSDNDLTEHLAERLLRQETQVRWVRRGSELPVTSVMPDQLRVLGDYPRLAERLRDKQRRLHEAGLAEASLADLDLTWDELLDWYVERLGTPRPVDLTAFAVAHGYADEVHLRRVLLREYAYTVRLEAAPPSAVAD